MALILCGSVSASIVEEPATIEEPVDDSTNPEQQSPADISITGTVLRCDNGEPFPGVNITAGDNGNTIASTTTDDDGNYQLNFQTTSSIVNLTANYLGHEPSNYLFAISDGVTQNVNFTLGVTEYADPVEATDPSVATFVSLGNYNNIYIHYYGGNSPAGVLNMNYLGTIYPSFCIDLYTPISIGDTLLVNGGLSEEIYENVEWCKVNYILQNYDPTTNNEAAAIQAAIWYFTTAPFGPYPGTIDPPKYQFMTYTNLNSDGDPVRARALEIIAAAETAGCMSYPLSISLTPESATLPNGQTLELTATVFDQHGNPLPGITVMLETDKGTLSSISGTTDSNGQFKVNLTTDGLFDDTATILAWVEGKYGTFLYDTNREKQSLTTTTLIPHSIEDVSTVNFTSSADLVITKEVSDPRPMVNDTIFYTIIVQNRGPNTAVNVRVVDILPAGLTYVSSVANYGSYNPDTGLWIMGNLPNGAIAELFITSIVTRPGDITNKARVISDTYDPIIENTSSSASLVASTRPTPTPTPTPNPAPVHGKTVSMQKTGLPVGLLILAILMVLGGVLREKN